MAQWINGIERPKKEDFEEHDREIHLYTIRFLKDDLESGEYFDIIQALLYSANTLRNYYKQSPIEGGSKRRRGSDSDSKCTLW